MQNIEIIKSKEAEDNIMIFEIERLERHYLIFAVVGSLLFLLSLII